MRNIAQKKSVLRKKKCAKLFAFHAKKMRKKKICAKIAQILRKKYSHFVETLVLTFIGYKPKDKQTDIQKRKVYIHIDIFIYIKNLK